jgi:hypothetical protein
MLKMVAFLIRWAGNRLRSRKEDAMNRLPGLLMAVLLALMTAFGTGCAMKPPAGGGGIYNPDASVSGGG